ncbi:fimbria/pilus outer membrane usher protein [Stenotrophomonas sp. CFBP 13718]|uniref:fimbria/pilus outer membrane usher protein n=1 Tax=Stenotrophomonas sp. CFBP 13718 TaxID=2775304 RepID=UPI0017870852|nr:fimbria/pilus outer membrane usher protein [Stenotrophomonas sp. CFBP 13718]MBD8695683.1 fimbrial biogenesis outer membrane usher protein [Stenotrophomonas sp. CFBP 13718]
MPINSTVSINSVGSLTLAITIALSTWTAQAETASPLQFSDGFLAGGTSFDLQHYLDQDRFQDGSYPLDIVINGKWHESAEVAFRDGAACLTVGMVQRLHLKVAYHETLAAYPAACVPLPTLIPGATVEVDGAALQLQIGIPQAALASGARGEVAAAQRDQGISAGFIDYTFNENRSNGGSARYLSLRSGLNLGAWRLRHRASLSQDHRAMRYNVLGSTLQRDLPAWNSQLVIGQAYTGGDLFPGIAFTGVRVATDERMLPDSLRGYAPVVRGVADSNAVVRIRQNGVVIHEVAVSPGPFLIDDLYPTSFGGDLEVSVIEADGREQQFLVGFSAVPQALRAGATRFSATAGTLRSTGRALDAWRFTEATYARGIGNPLTLVGGLQLAEYYRAAVVGAAVNTPLGAFGLDMTRSQLFRRNTAAIAGNSLRVNYQRYVERTGTHVGVAAYHYSTGGFLALADAVHAPSRGNDVAPQPRQRYQVNLSQRLGERSSLYISGGHASYRDGAQRQNDVQFGLQSTLGRANYGASVTRYRNGMQAQHDTRYALTFSLPLGGNAGASRLHALLSPAQREGRLQLGLSGTSGEADDVSYNVSAASTHGRAANYNSNVAYRSGLGTLTAGYGGGAGYDSLNLGAAGSVVFHAGGINPGVPLGDGFALIQAAGAVGAHVGSGDPIRVARNGYAVLPHVSPYRWNQIDLDPAGLPLEIELQQTSQRVAPTAGSIVRVVFDARAQRTLFIDATDVHGDPLPFAALLEDEEGQAMGAVGQGGVIQLRGALDKGVLIVDPQGSRRCRLDYRIPNAADVHGLWWHVAQCVPLSSDELSPPLPLPLRSVDAPQ